MTTAREARTNPRAASDGPWILLAMGVDDDLTHRLHAWLRGRGVLLECNAGDGGLEQYARVLRSICPDIVILDDQTFTHLEQALARSGASTVASPVPLMILTDSASHPEAPVKGVVKLDRSRMTEAIFLQHVRCLVRRQRGDVDATAVGSVYPLTFLESPAATALARADGLIVEANDAFAAMLGYGRPELAGMASSDLFHSEDRPGYRSLLAALVRTRGQVESREIRLKHLSGHMVWCDLHARAIAPEGQRDLLLILQVCETGARRELEEALRRSEAWFRALAEHHSDGTLLLGKRGQILYASSSASRILGYSFDELTGRNCKEFLHPADGRINRSFFVKVLRVRPGVSLATIRVMNGQGTWRWLEVTATNRLHSPDVKAIVVNFHDITEHRRAVDLLQRQAMIVAHLNDAVVVTDPAGRIVDCNPALSKMFGYQKAQLVGQSSDLLQCPNCVEQVAEGILACLDTGRPWSAETCFLHRDGARGTCELTAIPLHDRRAQFLGLVLVYHDISARKQAEAELASSERRYRELFDHANDLIFTADFQGRLTDVNPSVEVVLNRSRKDLIGAGLSSFLTGSGMQVIVRAIEQLQRGELPPIFEIEAWRGERETVTLEVGAQRLDLEDGRAGFQAIARDITDRRQLELQLRQAQKMEALGRLAGGVAHDFNNLLTVIGGYSEVIREDLPPGHDLIEAAEEIIRAVERASGLTRHLLAFSRRQVLRPTVLRLNNSLPSTTSLLRRIMGEDIEIEVESDPDLYPIRADLNQMEQVILNLAVNARDAMPGGGRFSVRFRNITVPERLLLMGESMPAGDYVELTVRDTGMGMDAEVKARIFEPFFSTKGERGTGLGLSTVHGIVHQSHGYIAVDSAPGAGTSFTIFFPATSELEVAPARAELPSVGSGHETILLVEDDDEVRSLILRLLRGHGYTVLVGSCGEDAVRLCGEYQEQIDLVVSDVRMPGLRASDQERMVRELCPKARILYISGYAISECTPDLGAGEASFLAKPFHPAELLHCIRHLLDQSD